MPKSKKKHPTTLPSRLHLQGCQRPLQSGLLLAVLYAVVMMGMSALGWQLAAWVPPAGWALAQAALGVGVLCLYRLQKVSRWGAVGAVLLLSAALTLAPSSVFLSQAVQALALTGFSLVLYDVDKLTGAPLRLPGGLIFLAVVGTLLNSPLMAFAGLALLALGSAIAMIRM